MEDEVTSISERIEELQDARPRNSDEIAKARDKRKRVRADISNRKHDVRLVEADIDALKMRFKWLVDYEVRDDEEG
jgi:septation ring formation regulator EzrA